MRDLNVSHMLEKGKEKLVQTTELASKHRVSHLIIQGPLLPSHQKLGGLALGIHNTQTFRLYSS